MLWLMFLRLKVSDAAAKMATSSTPAAMRALESREIRHERRVARPRPSRDAGEDLRGVRHLRHPLRADERRHLDDRQARRAQASTNAILSAVGIDAASFCSPSRGPTSTTVTRRRDPSSSSTSARPVHELARRQCTASRPVAVRRESAAPSSSLPVSQAYRRSVAARRQRLRRGSPWRASDGDERTCGPSAAPAPVTGRPKLQLVTHLPSRNTQRTSPRAGDPRHAGFLPAPTRTSLGIPVVSDRHDRDVVDHDTAVIEDRHRVLAALVADDDPPFHDHRPHPESVPRIGRHASWAQLSLPEAQRTLGASSRRRGNGFDRRVPYIRRSTCVIFGESACECSRANVRVFEQPNQERHVGADAEH